MSYRGCVLRLDSLETDPNFQVLRVAQILSSFSPPPMHLHIIVKFMIKPVHPEFAKIGDAIQSIRNMTVFIARYGRWARSDLNIFDNHVSFAFDAEQEPSFPPTADRFPNFIVDFANALRRRRSVSKQAKAGRFSLF
ncbi:hypothetical protein SCP_0310960 [Sparassis crispa]|uniref:Uncharacterized protein n=1 Tax=Sparassis crispa TaxID=139825 RepID=A0A401GGR8_9APHY|nr:hypothetical protein SCP_0310960 [Sparassis crispa]GBE81369.1 hypothetical protein SCP_0310960 [Sparassis crispa]